MIKKQLMFLLFTSLLVLITGCNIQEVKEPFLKEVYLEPTFIRGNTDDSSNIIYTITNPLTIKFTGRVSILYSEECLSISKNQDVVVPSTSEVPYSTQVSKSFRFLEKCYGDQTISIILTDDEGKLRYDIKNVVLKVTR